MSDPNQSTSSDSASQSSQNGDAANPYAPRAQDNGWTRAAASIRLSEVLVAESFPVQVTLHLTGMLPTACHELRISPVNASGQKEKIVFDVYSVVDPAKTCPKMSTPFDVRVPLGSYQSGKYSVWVNNTQVGSFTL